MPAGYKVPAHWHPQYENVTVLTGEFNVGMGDKLDTSKGMALRPGGYVEARPRCTTMLGLVMVKPSYKSLVLGHSGSPTSIQRMILARNNERWDGVRLPTPLKGEAMTADPVKDWALF